MASADELLQPLLAALTPVPAVQPGVCSLCHSSVSNDFPQCYKCGVEASAIGPVEVVPVTMSVEGGFVNSHLRGYKRSRDPATRQRMALRLAALLSVFLREHGDCLGHWDTATCVPSAAQRAMNAVARPIRRVSDNLDDLLDVPPGNWDRLFSQERFTLTRDVSGERVLLLDDTFASGASVMSAAAVLRDGGADVIGPVVLGRHVAPQWPPSAEILDWLLPRRWDPGRCCRCDGERRDPAALF